jgi:nucleotide-binding universal stress UspA family protein
VTAVPQPWVSIAVYPPGPPFGSYPEFRRVQAERMKTAWNIVEGAGDEFTRAGFEVHTGVLSGSPASHLLKEAESISADLVVIGSRGLGPVKRALVGSVSDQVVRHAPATLVGRH